MALDGPVLKCVCYRSDDDDDDNNIIHFTSDDDEFRVSQGVTCCTAISQFQFASCKTHVSMRCVYTTYVFLDGI